MNWFINCNTESERKARLRTLLKNLHPDVAVAGLACVSNEIVRSVLSQYEEEEPENEQPIHFGARGQKQIEALRNFQERFPAVEFTIADRFIVAGFNSFENKDKLKAAGFKWDLANRIWKIYV